MEEAPVEETPITYTYQTRSFKSVVFPLKGEQNGVSWIWRFFADQSISTDSIKNHLTLKIEYTELEGVYGYLAKCKGSLNGGSWINKVVTLGNSEWVECFEFKGEFYGIEMLAFEFSLTPIRVAPEVVIEEGLFEPTEWTDAVLVVEGVRVHVLKGLLASHSDYFRNLFFADFKERTMEEIPIEDVKYHEFIDLLKTIHLIPRTNESEPEAILKLADRFLMKNVTKQIESELIDRPNMRSCKLLRMSDRYGLDRLTAMVVGKIGCARLMGQVCKSSEYEEFSDRLKARLMDKMSPLIDKMDEAQRNQSRKRGHY